MLLWGGIVVIHSASSFLMSKEVVNENGMICKNILFDIGGYVIFF